MKIKSLKGLSKEQERIYQGLCLIGELLGAFYLDGVMMLRQECMLQTKVNLIAHSAREIDGGFRDVFAPAELKKAKEKSIKGKDNGHYASILVALGFNNDAITDEWIAVAGQFHKLAHRHGAWLKPKDESEISSLWARYEKILNILTGSMYALGDRIERLLAIDVPTKEILGALKNLFYNKQNEFQFYKSLDKIGWLQPLFDENYLCLTEASIVVDEQGHRFLQDWLPLRYLANIADKIDVDQELLISNKILAPLKKEVTEGRLFIDDYSLYNYSVIVSKLPTYVFDASDSNFLITCSAYMRFLPYPMHESVLLDDLLKHYTETKSREGLINLLVYSYGFTEYEEKVEGFEGLEIYAQKQVVPNIKIAGHHHWSEYTIKDIIAITGIELPLQLTAILVALSRPRFYELSSLPSVEQSSQTNMYIHDWILSLINLIRDSGEQLSWAECEALIENLLESNTEINTRIALHLMRIHLPVSMDLFSSWIQQFRLYGHFPIHELYLLLQLITPSINMDQFDQLLNWIENIEFDEKIYAKQDIEKSRAHQIRRYLASFAPVQMEQVEKLATFRKTYDELVNWPLDHPEFDYFATTQKGFDIPVTTAEFEKLSVKEQLDYLQNYNPSNEVMDTSPQGLGILLNNSVIRNPEIYEKELESLLGLDEFYLTQVIYGFSTALKNGHLNNWRKVLDTLEKVTASEGFTKDNNDSDQQRLLTSLADMLLQIAEQGEILKLTADDIAYLISLTTQILAVERYKQTEPIPYKDQMHYRLNTMPGKAYDALELLNRIWLADEANDGLHPLLKTFLEKGLSQQTPMDQDFSLALGYHFSYFLAADSAWCLQFAKEIFSEEKPEQLQIRLSALLTPYKDVYKNVIRYLTSQGVNRHAVGLFRAESGELNRLARFALTEFFIINTEALDQADSLVSLLIADGQPDQLLSLIKVAVKIGYAPNPQLTKLWQVLQEIALKDPEKYREMLAHISNLAQIGTLDRPIINLITATISYLTDGPTVYQLSNKIFKSPGISPEVAGKLVLAIWNQANTRVWVNEELTAFLDRLYQEGHKALADEIASYVAEKGDFGLKTVYDKYQISDLGLGINL